MYFVAEILAWLIALAWVLRVVPAARGMATIPDLLLPEYDLSPTGSPTITVIVPARNEEKEIRACLESLLAQDYANIRIIAVNDRSTDTTGAIMDSLSSDRLQTIHIAELPVGWLGKTHAMATAAASSDSDFLLFTDADMLFRADAIRRTLAHAVASGADHLVLGPTTIIRRWDEPMLLAFFQICGLLAVRAWKVADPDARDSIGIGAFNLIRTRVYRRIGGFEAQPMAIAEDIELGRRVKAAGFAQRFVSGRTLASVYWAEGAAGIVRGMTKNIFSIYRFRIELALGGCVAMTLLCIMPFVAVWFRPLTIPAAISIAAIFLGYRTVSRLTGFSTWNALLEPFAAALIILAILRSVAVTVVQGGVTWRGTFYPLAELRKHQTPIIPRGQQ
jgi:cellulose synthase/poly-beta-1,6-N-acetylglucosamine synthase-like glycosyltransferase